MIGNIRLVPGYELHRDVGKQQVLRIMGSSPSRSNILCLFNCIIFILNSDFYYAFVLGQWKNGDDVCENQALQHFRLEL